LPALVKGLAGEKTPAELAINIVIPDLGAHATYTESKVSQYGKAAEDQNDFLPPGQTAQSVEHEISESSRFPARQNLSLPGCPWLTKWVISSKFSFKLGE
jgi:hypothetical protein